jgi:hypothetical protein
MPGSFFSALPPAAPSLHFTLFVLPFTHHVSLITHPPWCCCLCDSGRVYSACPDQRANPSVAGHA